MHDVFLELKMNDVLEDVGLALRHGSALRCGLALRCVLLPWARMTVTCSKMAVASETFINREDEMGIIGESNV
jgi:hypothetical protein